MMIEPQAEGSNVSDKPEIDIQRIEYLEELRRRAHGETMAATEIYRQRAEERTERAHELRQLDASLQHRFRGNLPEDWAAERERVAARAANAERRFNDADTARMAADEKFQTAGRLYDRCIEWCQENKIEVNA
jgi:hypothetical protein